MQKIALILFYDFMMDPSFFPNLILIYIYMEGKQVEGAVWDSWPVLKAPLSTNSHSCTSVLESQVRSRFLSSGSVISCNIQGISVPSSPWKSDNTPNNYDY